MMRYFKCDDLKPKDREIITQDISLTEEEKKRQEELRAEQAELAAAEASSELNQKLSAPIVVQVNEQPKVPEGFGKKQTKKKSRDSWER
jgi:hypothetical protein